MRIRRIAVLIDGGFLLKRLPHLVEPSSRTTPAQVAEIAFHLCKRHVQRITHLNDGTFTGISWLDHVYRLFYYDAVPFNGLCHHPILNRSIEFGKTDAAKFREALFTELRHTRNFAVRLGEVAKVGGWALSSNMTKQVLRVDRWISQLATESVQHKNAMQLDPIQLEELSKLLASWVAIHPGDVNLELRQKGVDMRIGLDIASMSLKGQVDTIVLVTGDSDFVPAAKLARREGVEFVLDPLWQSVSDELNEHVDGIASAFPKPEVEPPSLIAA